MEYLYVPTEHQRAILETVRRFVEEEVIPRAASLDAEQDPAKCYSWEIVEKAHALGIRTMTLGEKWGGLGADPLTTAMVIEELSKGDLGVGVTLGQTMKLAQIFQSGLNEEQKDRVLPKFAEDSRGMLAIGITEPDNASNYLVPFPVPFRTVAVKAKGGWIVNGMKHFISNANRASFFLFFAQTEKDKSMTQGSTCFLVERGRPGFSIGRVHDKMGERLANNAEMIFDDCFIPDENVVGKVGDGFAVFEGEPGQHLLNPMGSVHGGWALTLIDSVGGCAGHSLLPAGSGYTTIETKGNFARPITKDTGRVRAEARVVSQGRQVISSEARVLSRDGKVLAHGTTTILVVSGGK